MVSTRTCSIRAVLAAVAAALVAGPASAEPAIKTILQGLYPASGTTIKLVKNGGNVDINDPSFNALFAGSGGARPITTTSGGQFWDVAGSDQSGDFDLRAKYASNTTTFGIFNPPSSTQSGAPAGKDFAAIMTVSSSGVQTNLTVNSHLTGGIASGTGPLNNARTNGNAQDSNESPTQNDANNHLRSITGTAFTPSASTVFRVTNFGDPFAFGIRSPVSVSGSNVNIGTGTANQFSSVNSQNANGKRHMLTFEVTTATQSLYVLAFEDVPSGDFDYNDLVIELNPTVGQPLLAPTPEPVTLAMFGVGFLGLAGARLRTRRQAAAEVVA